MYILAYFVRKRTLPPLRLLIDFLKARGQTPIVPTNIDDAALDEWAWVQISLGYHRDRKPVNYFAYAIAAPIRTCSGRNRRNFVIC